MHGAGGVLRDALHAKPEMLPLGVYGGGPVVRLAFSCNRRVALPVASLDCGRNSLGGNGASTYQVTERSHHSHQSGKVLVVSGY